MSEEKTDGRRGVTRLSFIKSSAGLLAGAASVAVPAAVANAAEPRAVEVHPSGGTEREPVVAWVRNAKRGEVTVVSGMSEKTYRDPALVKRLLAAAPKQRKGGGS
ncbi:MAG TPA: hypothetical protein VMU66_10995 [Gaiellales bacterium]|nr:hypothetical protein [Gaiellales bacterium]HVC84874.1 hypothetical protein [Solirubrobacteraceae bacterium]